MPVETDFVKTFLPIMTIIQGAQANDGQKVAYGSMQMFGYGSWVVKSLKYKDASIKILWTGIAILVVARTLVGSPKNGGESFTAAASEWGDANFALQNAVVDPNYWSGSAADAYSAQNAAQMARVLAMQEIDTNVAGILARELTQLQYVALNIDWEIAVLMGLIPFAIALYYYEPQASYAFQMAAIAPALAYTEVLLGKMSSKSAANAQKVMVQKQNYNLIAQGATGVVSGPKSYTSPPADVSTSTLKTTLPQFDELSNVAPVSAESDMAAPATLSPSPDKSASPLASTASTGDSEGSEDASPAAPSEGQQPQTEAMPAATIPAASQTTSSASQSATPVGLTNPTTGQASQTASSARQGPSTQRDSSAQQDAPGEAVGTGSSSAGATAGGADAERAPIGTVTSDAQQAQESAPVERMG